MELRPGLSALVTGGANGIGKALAMALAEKGVSVSIVDISEQKGNETALLIMEKNAKLQCYLHGPAALFIMCDVTNTSDIAAAFQKHLLTFGGLDICINAAGIGTSISFYEDRTDGEGSWRKTIRVNLMAVIDCTRLAIQAIQSGGKPGTIVNIGSSAGLYPLDADPIYSASKGGIVLFTRSLMPYKHERIRINVLCPEFVETDMTSKINPELIKGVGGFVSMEMVIHGAFELITDEHRAGHCLWITPRRGMEYWPTLAEEAKYRVNIRMSSKSLSSSLDDVRIPQFFERIVAHSSNCNFRSATGIVRTCLSIPISPKHVIVKVLYAGVSGDVNFTAGSYFDCYMPLLPFDSGFEAVGLIVGVGESVSDLTVGASVAAITSGCYSEFLLVHSNCVLPVPRPDPEILSLLISGLSASIALEKAAQMASKKAVLVTAAAGDTGQFAVQLAKLAGNTVVATCSGEKKAGLLMGLGVDRIIDYKTEDIETTLLKEYPKGLDIIYDSSCGEMFETCLNALAILGRLIVVGMTTQYQSIDGGKPSCYPRLCEKILAKKQTVVGFCLLQYKYLWQQHLDKLLDLYSNGDIKVYVDPKKFLGLRSVADAVEYAYSGESIGKVVVCIDPASDQQPVKL